MDKAEKQRELAELEARKQAILAELGDSGATASPTTMNDRRSQELSRGIDQGTMKATNYGPMAIYPTMTYPDMDESEQLRNRLAALNNGTVY